MAFSLSELLNPEPADGANSSHLVNSVSESQPMDSTEPPSTFFAPELFQPDDDAPPPDHDAFDRKTHLEDTRMDDEPLFQSAESVNNYDGANDEDHVKQETVETSYPPLEGEGDTVPAADSSIMDMIEDGLDAEGTPSKDSSQPHKQRKHPGKSRKVDSEGPPKSSVHSSKNEGQHTDRRYLCYLCNKLFTRRRSVRDHISKIHNTKTWEPVRSLEIVVDPNTGEPLEPLEDIIARGPPPPPPKPSKAERAKKLAAIDQEEEHHHHHNGDEEERQEEETIPISAPPALESSPPAPSAVTILKKEPSTAGSRASSSEPFATPAPVVGKKRPAPDDSVKPLSAGARKKGTAKIKSASNKRPRLSEAEQSPPAARSTFRSPSATPSSHQLKPLPSKLKKQTSAASVHSSPTPASSRAASREVSASPSVADTPTSSNDDGEVFCICRKGDNHTWMIACDGGCDEWFHGNCVNIRERDGELIDKYICPTCTKPGLQTTWKRMCRRKDCRKPARVTQMPPSKYCSDPCGRMFFVELVQRGDPQAQATKNGEFIVEMPKTKKQRKKHAKKEKQPKPVPSLTNGVDPDSRLATPAYSDDEKTEYETDSSLDDDMLPNRGAALRAGEVKALIDRCKNIEEWKALGRKPDTPPRDMDVTMSEDTKPEAPQLEYDELELGKWAGIEAEKLRLKARNDMLSAREQFLELAKARSTNITEEVRKGHPKMKDLCGFDPRVAWSDEEFLTWYNERGGKAILDAGADAKIGPPEDLKDESSSSKLSNGVTPHDENAMMDDEDDESDTMPKKGGVCIKNRCPRHRNWAKGQLAEVRYEQDLVRRALQRHEAAEEELRGRAIVRAWEKRG